MKGGQPSNKGKVTWF